MSHWSHSRVGARVGLAAAVLITLVATFGPPGARAASHGVAPRVISGPDPLPAFGAPGACGSEPPYQNWEQEPALAVDAASPKHLVSAWIQDYSDAIAVASTSDSGDHWSRSLPHTASCTWPLGTTPSAFASFNSAFDPSVSFGPSRLAKTKAVTYLTSVLANARDSSSFAVAANRSTDGGRTWSEPVLLDRTSATTVATPAGALPVTGSYIDWSNVVADPIRPDRAYAIWQRGDVTFTTRTTYTSHTVDGGLHWSAAAPGPVTPAGSLQAAGRLLVLPDGSVVDVLVQVPPQPALRLGTIVGPTTIVASRSTDGGVTWNPPVTVAVADTTHYVVPGVGVGRDGAISVAWDQAAADGSSFDLVHTRSVDGGTTWSAPAPIESGIHGPTSSADVAVAPDGSIGVLSYDHRNDVFWYAHRQDVEKPKSTITDAWLHSSADGGRTWRLDHLAGPFDQSTAPSIAKEPDGGSGAGFLGDFQGIAPLPNGFATAFTLASPVGDAGFTLQGPPTDIFFATRRS